MRKLEMTTGILPIVCVNLYNTPIGDGVPNELAENFIECLVCSDEDKEFVEDNIWLAWDCDKYKVEVTRFAIQYVKRFFEEHSDILNAKVLEGAVMWSPEYYNYSTDRLEFDIEVDESELERIKNEVQDNDEFFRWAAENYGHRLGFMSYMPFTKEGYMKAITVNGGDYDLGRAVAMYVSWQMKKQGIDYQEDFEYEMYEWVSSGIVSILDFFGDNEAADRIRAIEAVCVYH